MIKKNSNEQIEQKKRRIKLRVNNKIQDIVVKNYRNYITKIVRKKINEKQLKRNM
jgi:F0F1-type ATP synthase membrane subunit b/b'